MAKIASLDWLAFVLVFIGALNWGLVGIFDFNAVTALFGDGSVLTKISYVVIGLAALYYGFIATRLGKK